MPNATEPPSLILIVDDSVDAIHLLAGTLAGEGEILFATTGEAGLELARTRRPQLILLDVRMDDMDGYEVCRRLAADPDSCDATIIFVTAHSDPASEVAALEAGAVDFLSKPLNPPVVRARVRIHLKLHKAMMAQARLANLDGLTGLFNRRYFDNALAQEFLRHRRQHLPLSLAFIDIDCFKAYNDHYGHQQGDECLRQVGELILDATRRPGELCARYGGEEFVAILPYTNAHDASKYGENLCELVAARALPHAKSSAIQHVTVSIGVATFVPGANDQPEALIAAADRALYLAKQDGRNRCIAAQEP